MGFLINASLKRIWFPVGRAENLVICTRCHGVRDELVHVPQQAPRATLCVSKERGHCVWRTASASVTPCVSSVDISDCPFDSS